MNSITDLISDKAEKLFPTSTQPKQTDNIIDLEDYTDTDVNQNTTQEIKMETISNDLNNPQEVSEVNTAISPALPKAQVDIKTLKAKIYEIKDQLDAVLRLIESNEINLNSEELIKDTPKQQTKNQNSTETILEGIFDGEKMIGTDNNEYAIPPNYASKSKLVEGDILKLTITNNGRFIYKQISPVERDRKIGVLAKSAEAELWRVAFNNKLYKVLNASVAFYKGKPGDKVIFIIAKNIPNSWAAIDNIIKQKTISKNSLN